MDENVRIRGIYTVVKFIVNTNFDDRNQNRIITKTLGKFGVVDTDYQGPCPNHDEFWLCKIVKEIKSGTPKGCFVLTPIMKLARSDIRPLIPKTGFSTEYEEGGICYVTPTNPNNYYFIPLDYRKSNKNHRVTICVNPGILANRTVSEVTAPTPTRNPYAPVPSTDWEPKTHGWDESTIQEHYETRSF